MQPAEDEYRPFAAKDSGVVDNDNGIFLLFQKGGRFAICASKDGSEISLDASGVGKLKDDAQKRVFSPPESDRYYSEISYDSLRHVENSAPPKRFFRRFWRSVARRLMEQEHARRVAERRERIG